jgi:hypothetical protein
MTRAAIYSRQLGVRLLALAALTESGRRGGSLKSTGVNQSRSRNVRPEGSFRQCAASFQRETRTAGCPGRHVNRPRRRGSGTDPGGPACRQNGFGDERGIHTDVEAARRV